MTVYTECLSSIYSFRLLPEKLLDTIISQAFFFFFYVLIFAYFLSFPKKPHISSASKYFSVYLLILQLILAIRHTLLMNSGKILLMDFKGDIMCLQYLASILFYLSDGRFYIHTHRGHRKWRSCSINVQLKNR